jgi:hypothetical protein
MRSGYYDGELDRYYICDLMSRHINDHVNIIPERSKLKIYSRYTDEQYTYTLKIVISPKGNYIKIYCWRSTDFADAVITKPSYYNFLYSNIERMISDDWPELKLGRFIHTEFVKLAEYYSKYWNTDNYVFSQLPTKK